MRTSGIRPVVEDTTARIAPNTTPQMLPMPPRMTIASTKIENENANWSALTVLRHEARNAPETPPNAAPEA